MKLERISDVLHEIGDAPDPEARLATVRITANRVEIVLLERDPDWVRDKLDIVHSLNEDAWNFVIAYRGYEDDD